MPIKKSATWNPPPEIPRKYVRLVVQITDTQENQRWMHEAMRHLQEHCKFDKNVKGVIKVEYVHLDSMVTTKTLK